MDHHRVDHRRGGVCRPAGGEGVSGEERIGEGDDDGGGVRKGGKIKEKSKNPKKSFTEIPILYIYP